MSAMTLSGEQLYAEITASVCSGTTDDPYPLLAELRRETPVRPGDVMVELELPSLTAHHDGPVYSLFRYDDVAGALRDADSFSSSIWAPLWEPFLGRWMIGLDGEEHRLWRGLLLQVFTRRSLQLWDATLLRPLAARLADDIALDRSADLVRYALAFPLRAIYEIIGFTDELDGWDEFQATALAILMALAVETDAAKAEEARRNFERALRAADDLLDGLRPLIERKRAAGAEGSDLISHLIRAEFDGGRLEDEEIARFVRSILPAATDNTTRQFLNAAVCMLERPELLDAMRTDRSLVMPAIVEAERYESPVLVLPRVTTRELRVRHETIPSGAAIVLVVGSANRDEEAYVRPDEFVIGREGPHPLAFGFGAHICPGMSTARLEIRAMLEALLDRLPGLRLDPDAAPPKIRGVQSRGPSELHVVWGDRG